MLKHGAKINLADIDGNTSLAVAAYSGKTDIVKLLLANGALVDTVNRNGDTPLMLACKASQSTESKDDLLKVLMLYGADKHRYNLDGKTAVTLRENPDSTEPDRLPAHMGVTPMHLAVNKGNTDIMEMFANIKLPGPSPMNKATYNGLCPLHLAVYKGFVDGVKVLINLKADLDLFYKGKPRLP